MLPEKTGNGERTDVFPSIPADSQAAALAAARSAWCRGNMDDCLARLDELGVPKRPTERTEATLLRARALFRLKHYDTTAAMLAPLLDSFADADEAATARMLHGAAIVRAGEFERGLALLAAAAKEAESRTVHRAIRAEIAHARALGHWLRGHLGEAEQFALDAEAAGADVISVRATQLLGFIARSRGSYLEALTLFRVAHDAYWHCRYRDRELVEMTVLEVAALEVQLRSKNLRGSHDVVGARRVADDGETCGRPSAAQAQTAALDAWLYALDGDAAAAFRKMREADEIALSPAWRVWTLAERAAMALAFGERRSAADHANAAVGVADAVHWNETRAEERVGLLLLAETFANLGRPDESEDLLMRHDAITASYDPGEVLGADGRICALEEYVRGLILRSRGKRRKALELLRSAAARFERVGHIWRCALARIELTSTLPREVVAPGVARWCERDEAFEAIHTIIRDNFPKSFLGPRVGLLPVDDPVIRQMPRAQRAVLELALDGLDGPEIAERTGRAYNTVRNHLARIRARFGVSSNAALLLVCCRRGLGGRSVRDVDACEDSVTGSHPAKRPRTPRRPRKAL